MRCNDRLGASRRLSVDVSSLRSFSRMYSEDGLRARRERHPFDRGKAISEFPVALDCNRSFSKNNLSLSLSMLYHALRKK